MNDQILKKGVCISLKASIIKEGMNLSVLKIKPKNYKSTIPSKYLSKSNFKDQCTNSNVNYYLVVYVNTIACY